MSFELSLRGKAERLRRIFRRERMYIATLNLRIAGGSEEGGANAHTHTHIYNWNLRKSTTEIHGYKMRKQLVARELLLS